MTAKAIAIPDNPVPDLEAASEPKPTRRFRFAKPDKKKLFWAWIGYQTVKGLTTTTLIWVPLWMAFRLNS